MKQEIQMETNTFKSETKCAHKMRNPAVFIVLFISCIVEKYCYWNYTGNTTVLKSMKQKR
jgi:hypothetical protein